ncbi:hypothetical protein GCM10028777_24180 [Angustibacter speluncae]
MAIDMDKSAAVASTALSSGYAVPRVNLLPPEILAERRLRRTQLGLAAVVLAVTGLVAGGFVLSAASVAQAEDALADEQSVTNDLLAEQAKYSEVPKVIAEVEAAQAGRETAMSSDVLWFDYLSHLSASYPENVWVKDLTVTAAPASATAVPDPTGLVTPGIATISVSGTARSHDDVAAWLDVLDATPGFADATYSVAARNDIETTALVDFSSTVTVTEDALSHRFESKDSGR